MSRTPCKDMCELVEALSTMLRTEGKELPGQIAKFNSLRLAARQTNAYQYQKLCDALGIDPRDRGADILKAQP